MRAVVYDRYGGPDELRLEDVPVPVPRAGQVLVEVVATSINLSDWESLTGRPAYARMGGLTAPRRHVLGSDIAGRVAAVGPGVLAFRVGDEVYGDNLQLMGGFAEYAVAPASALAPKPAGLSFAEASTIPQSGAIALQAVARVKPGERMLINGAGGGSGSFAMQLAKAAGVHVTGVDNAAKLAFVRELGADEVIDYRAQDFTRTGPYDLIVDFVASRSVFAYRRALARGGRYFMVGGTTRTIFRLLTLGTLVGAVTGTRLGLLVVQEGPSHFTPLADRILAGEVSVHIDSVHPLEAVPHALAHHGEGRALGKVVVAVRPE
ncbi:NAD(P)-dependent alcohol dehydrogenase [Microbacterium sp. 4R-513]|uniref:NAD(P)-dependent alcohol dehydrogenase n=1 Tax=Microbacterium sp. 4R-513 TaxID=2567934 RepID=UPI0013E18420|nr:NAD(P)-dependent alcohol dehydrogenase [Microbacterium sp. 4R-513]QIG40054.1 NAD(P)-dependent alcohol dehydrogenase [Microbacterium sp. 4R-513]